MGILIEACEEAYEVLRAGGLDVWRPVVTSLQVSGAASLMALALGMPVGIAIGTKRFAGRRMLLVVANTGMGLPPVVVGLFVVMLLSRRGPLGALDWLYTRPAMVLAETIIALPVVVAITATAVAAVPRELRLQARSLGAGRLEETLLLFREARMGLVAAVAGAFGAVISEVGSVMMVGGNIPGKTQVMTTAIVQYTRMGRMGAAVALAGVLLALVVVVNIVLTWVQESSARYEHA